MAGEWMEAEVLPPQTESAAGTEQDSTATAMAVLDAIRTGSDPQKVMMSLLGQAADQPGADMLLKMVGEGGEDSNEALREELREEIKEEQAEAVGALEAAAERLLAENRALMRRLEGLAAAIGACPACFGDDLLCETCEGAGTPGSRLPQAAEFHTYVRPAVDRVGAALRRAPARRPWPRHAPANLAAVETAARAGARP
ncbi:MAG TPA: hypothetical protein VGW40_07860 [Allosphingosinicella sp.]|nr:hypothetical protein [Allosphingosinicella sp.]